MLKPSLEIRPITNLWLIIFAIIFSVSPLLINIINIPGNYLYLFPLALFLLVNYKSIIFDLGLIFIALIIILFSFFPAIYYGAFRYLLIPIYIIITFPIIMIVQTKDWVYIISRVTNIIIILEILAIISLIYVFLFDASPLFCIANEDTRQNCMWGLTMTGSTIETSLGNIIRSSGIYDEPGTFSFIICMIVTIRYALGMNDKKTITLLFLGLVTLSLAHYLFTFLYMLNRVFFGKRLKITANSLLLGVILILILIIFRDILSTLIFSRLEFIDGNFVGNNRSERTLNTLSLINNETFFFGIGPNCVLTGYECDRSIYKVFDSNPFTLLAGYGIFLSITYYGFLLIYLYNFLTARDSFLMLGILMLLFIRPNVMTYGFALIAVLTVSLFLKKNLSELKSVK